MCNVRGSFGHLSAGSRWVPAQPWASPEKMGLDGRCGRVKTTAKRWEAGETSGTAAPTSRGSFNHFCARKRKPGAVWGAKGPGLPECCLGNRYVDIDIESMAVKENSDIIKVGGGMIEPHLILLPLPKGRRAAYLLGSKSHRSFR